MKRLTCVVFSAALWMLAAESRAVTIDTVPVGNAGNANDTTGFGAVPYAYKIDKYDVTNSQYAEFLNTKDPTGANTLGLWNANMASTPFGGINFNGGNLPGSRYVLTAGHQDHPVNAATWYDAIRFANWLNNGQAGGDTETGAYTLGPLNPDGTPMNGASITRNAGAKVFLPSENEWYKAAYYDPRTTAQGGPPSDSHYWLYGTSSSSTPIESGPTALANHANYDNFVGTPTDVGAYTGTTSPYGAFDMAGNVWQWNEALISESLRGLRGGSYVFSDWINLQSSTQGFNDPSLESSLLGFRVASTIPEPSTFALAALGVIGLLTWRLRRRAACSLIYSASRR